MNHLKDKELFIQAAHRIAADGLIKCSSGNLSYRVDNDFALISASGSWLSRITSDEISLCRISDKSHISGAVPSIESQFHLGIMKNRSDISVVLHFQSEYATIISCMKNKPANFNVITEIPLYIGNHIPIVPYLRPGSPELAEAVIDAMRGSDCIIMSNHGQVVCGRSFDDVIRKALFFELACKIIVLADDNLEFINPSCIPSL